MTPAQQPATTAPAHRERSIFRLSSRAGAALPQRVGQWMLAPLAVASRLPALDRVYGCIPPPTTPGAFFADALAALHVQYTLAPSTLSRIPANGPLIVVANHPFGAVDGLILGDILRQVRLDFKFLANFILTRIPELRDHVIAVDPFGSRNAVRRNIRPLKEALSWLGNGGALLVFPAGEVSHWQLRHRAVVDPAWHRNIAGLARHSQAPVLPVFFGGRNSVVFQLAGLMHPRLRTALIPHELLNKQKRKLQVEVGDVIPAERVAAFPSDDKLLCHLRFRTYMLRDRLPVQSAWRSLVSLGRSGASPAPLAAVIPPLPTCEPLQNEVDALPAEQHLYTGGGLEVWYAAAAQIPLLLNEIGRLREVTFRLAGEGTGNAVDLDRFDGYYLHLFVWNRERRELVGAYRLGQTDLILPRFGAKGLYTHTLFRFKADAIAAFGPALELGRSFVRPEYQRSFGSLLGLWKGIGQFVVRNPHYRCLFGPVSIPDGYCPVSRQLLAAFLLENHALPALTGQIRPRKPLRRRSWGGIDPRECAGGLRDIEELSKIIAGLEADAKGVPILIRQYLKLGGRLIGFNVDPKFSNVLDGLILVDLTRTETPSLEKYLGKDGATTFRRYHQMPGFTHN